MITASDLRPGATVERDGDLFEVIDFSHMKQGRGTAVIRAKLRNVTTGAVTDETFRPEEKFGRVRIDADALGRGRLQHRLGGDGRMGPDDREAVAPATARLRLRGESQPAHHAHSACRE